jgi:hypothetical protein
MGAVDAMNARPILFSAPMILALLDGRKTQTRRIVKPQPSAYAGGIHPAHAGRANLKPTPYFDSYRNAPRTEANPGRISQRWCWWTEDDRQGPDWIKCPYGVPGDVLWARESGLEGKRPSDFRIFAHDAAPGRYWVNSDAGRYGASYGSAITRESMIRTGSWKVRPSIHMPRWASRLTLQITDVRVEKLQDISEGDAEAEGVEPPATERENHDWSICPECGGTGLHGALGANLGYMEVDCADCDTHKKRYQHLWNKINGDGSWDANPFVWALTFTVHQQNVDAFMAAQAAA